jgi:hypothetical protein
VPRIKQIDDVVGAPVLAAAWCIGKGSAWAPAGQVAGVAGALAAEALRRRAERKDDAPASAAPEGNVVVAVTAEEVVTTTFSNVIGIKAKKVTARLPRTQVVGADLEGKRIIKTLTLHLADGSVWAFDCRTVSHKDAAEVVAALGF